MHLAASESLPCDPNTIPAAFREGEPNSPVGRGLSRAIGLLLSDTDWK